MKTFVAMSVVVLSTLGIGPAAAAGPEQVDVVMSDGVRIEATVLPAAPGSPLVLIPGEVGVPRLMYQAPLQALHSRGYTVIVYDPRGTFGSTGEFDFAGPREIQDVSELIDWAGGRFGTGAAAVAGMGNGGGTGLLAAAHDRRIRAVVSLGGWADLTRAWFPGGTADVEAIGTQRLLGGATSRFGADARHILDAADPQRFTAARDVDMRALAANRPAVFVGQAWGDSLYPPRQLVDAFAGYPGPLRLELSAGDHSVSDAPGGYLGLPNHDWDTAYRWLDAALRGTDPGLLGEPPLHLAPMTSSPAEMLGGQQYSAPMAVADLRPTTGLALGAGVLGAAAAATATTLVGGAAGVDSGPVYLTGALQYLGTVPPTPLGAVSPAWRTAVFAAPRRLVGLPDLTVTLGTAHPATLVAYLYDEGPDSSGVLLSHAPVTVTGTGSATVELQPVDWVVAAGHRLTLIVGTHDSRYAGVTTPGATITLTAGRLDLPLQD
ncbi:hypothetical protein KO481_10165 [Nocardia sp. NEAU-G5]|uniref:Xaa-Pro dipeptidyl-peptidase C-terminal domain-containing protein n=1 Tax=Nocardia albiluteola TaxID=2842303 RepID=A0ABS6AY17_9NOCA|nr:alpha/beta fold hydrolase [Nocardia albiluteola]MBU3061889.1 hypothetical protein [Nocardia albiluteola]